jgi:hypothetical protein
MEYATILILATLVEGLVEHLVKPLFFPFKDDADDNQPQELIHLDSPAREILLRYVSAAAGILFCFAYHADLLALAGLDSGPPFVGQAITGIVIGRGANYLHDLVSRWTLRSGPQPG